MVFIVKGVGSRVVRTVPTKHLSGDKPEEAALRAEARAYTPKRASCPIAVRQVASRRILMGRDSCLLLHFKLA